MADDTAPIGEPPFVDTPVLQAKRRAFDDPTQANLDALIAAVRAENAVGHQTERRHAQVAAQVWSMIRALADPDVGTSMVLKRDDDFHAAAVNLIEMACDSAAESQRIADGLPPKGAS